MTDGVIISIKSEGCLSSFRIDDLSMDRLRNCRKGLLKIDLVAKQTYVWDETTGATPLQSEINFQRIGPLVGSLE